ncbi:hypothetical protein AKJ63_00730 [candidate division MSBL1 archaeon SCGC-AAA259D18]|uniref:Uncharacterized protein n=1 Tax=candidate division MSBL1 archaeon SCGC-AAA259D18 TaxID=1698262 RepID=A0A133UCA1_9EURY|nr:hypothetical protein AKJ63_00730 [candidate division MSBL1 archaeon SCGC-AAA259D18]
MIGNSEVRWFDMPQFPEWLNWKDIVAVVFIAAGVVLAIDKSIEIREISFLPMCFGLTVLFLSIFVKLGRRGTLSRKGISYKPFIFLAGFALSFFIIGVIIPFMQGG